jgi:hypothetical protein
MSQNKYSYFTADGISKGSFNIYQGAGGFIYMVMGKGQCRLSLDQIIELKILCHELIDFDSVSYLEAYKNE